MMGKSSKEYVMGWWAARKKIDPDPMGVQFHTSGVYNVSGRIAANFLSKLDD